MKVHVAWKEAPMKCISHEKADEVRVYVPSSLKLVCIGNERVKVITVPESIPEALTILHFAVKSDDLVCLDGEVTPLDVALVLAAAKAGAKVSVGGKVIDLNKALQMLPRNTKELLKSVIEAFVKEKGKEEFTLAEIYNYFREKTALNLSKERVRQLLQQLASDGFLETHDGGTGKTYRVKKC